MANDDSNVTIGTTVYDDDGDPLGEIRGLTDDGFVVSTREGIEALSIEHERAGHEFGEAELLWRCAECGELGDIDDLPEECPNCGVDKTAFYYWTED
jgi:rubredoxin